MGSVSPSPPRASRLEILGAWLHVWTPPRGVRIPPPPSRGRLAGWGAVALLALTVVLVAVVPRIERAKDARARADAAAAVQRAEARRAETIRLQRPAFGSSAAATSPAVLDDARAEILAAARRRAAAGEFDGPIREVGCVPAAGAARADLRRYTCVASTQRLKDGVASASRYFGYPFSLVVQPATGRYAYCRSLPVPAEGATAHGALRIPQPAACRGAVDPVP